LNAKLNVSCDPDMTVQELNNFYKFIQAGKVLFELNEMITQKRLTQKQLTTYYNNIFNIVIKYKNQDKNQNISKKDIMSESFVCLMCSKNINVIY